MDNSNTNQPKIKDMGGYIAKNKKTKDTQPDWRGKVQINGKEFLLSLWIKNDEIMSVSVTDPEKLPPRPNQNSNSQSNSASNKSPGQGGQSVGTGISDPFDDIFGSLPGG